MIHAIDLEMQITCGRHHRFAPCRILRLCAILVVNNNLSGEKIMANVYIEARPKGREEGTSIEDYVVEEQGDRVLKTFKTQAEAITWAKSQGHSPHVARVRHLNDKKIPDHWRPV
jgi:hypothetical protein